MKSDAEKSVAQPVTPGHPSKSKWCSRKGKTPVQTAPAQDDFGRIGRTKGEGYQETSDEGDRSLFKEERRASLAEVS